MVRKKHKKTKTIKKDFVLDFLKKVSNIKSNLFEDKVFILVINTPLTEKIKILPLLWIILGFASIFAVDWYLGKRDINGIKVLFIITLFHFLTASAYMFSGLLAFIGTYFIFESKFKEN